MRKMKKKAAKMIQQSKDVEPDSNESADESTEKLANESAEKLADEPMEVEGMRIYNKKTMRDQYGNYPIWMNQRRILKNKCKKGRAKSQKATKKSNKRLTRRQKKTILNK